MARKNYLDRTLAVVGVMLVGFPILAPLVLALISLFREGVFRLDYLMPMELIFFALLGGGMLLLAALHLRSRWRGLLAWALGVVFVAPSLAQGLAILSGIASGERQLAGWQMGLILAFVVFYSLALIAMLVGGVLLGRDAFRPS